MQREIGDKVKVKSDLKDNQDCGEAIWLEEMDCYLGQEATITGILGASSYELNIDTNMRWEFTEDMLEPREVSE